MDLYKNANSGFLTMALDNAFRTDGTNIKSMPIKEFVHVVSVGEIGIYRHKSKRMYYVSFTTKPENFYESYGMGLKMFREDYFNFRILYMVNKIFYFESYDTELIFREIFDLL